MKKPGTQVYKSVFLFVLSTKNWSEKFANVRAHSSKYKEFVVLVQNTVCTFSTKKNVIVSLVSGSEEGNVSVPIIKSTAHQKTGACKDVQDSTSNGLMGSVIVLLNMKETSGDDVTQNVDHSNKGKTIDVFVWKATIRVSMARVWKSSVQMVLHGTQKEDSAGLYVLESTKSWSTMFVSVFQDFRGNLSMEYVCPNALIIWSGGIKPVSVHPEIN